MRAARRIIFGLRFRLLLLVLLAAAPLCVLTLFNASQERRRVVAAWQDRSRRLAELARREEKGLLGTTRQLLLAVSEASALQSTDPVTCKKALKEVLASYPSYANLGLAATNGEVLTSVHPLNASGGGWDQALVRRVLKTSAFAVGNYSAGPTSDGLLVSMGSPVFDKSERVQAVVFVMVPMDLCIWPGQEVARQVPAGAVWTAIDRNGTVLARYPPGGPLPGQPLQDAAIVKAAFAEPAGIVKARNSRGIPVYHAFALQESQLAAGRVASILEIPQPLLFGPTNRALKRNLGWLGLAAGLALALGWTGGNLLFVRPVKSLVRASARLAAGDLTARAGLRHGKDELGQLTRTFDQMAQTLEQRERERQLAEETLQTRDDILRQLPLQPTAVCVCDEFGAVELYNQAAVELWGYEPRDHPGTRRFCGAHQFFHPDGTPMPHSESPAAQALHTGTALRNRELVIGRPDGTRVPVLVNAVPLRDADGALIGVVSSYEDITERKRTQKVLHESKEKLQLLSRRLVESQETERRHIARELHDEVGQTLTVAEMNLQAMIQSSRTASPGSVRLKESLQAVERVLQQVRDLSLNLRPSMLDDLGLEPALRWYTKRQASLAGLKADFHADALEKRLDPVIETACFRVAQEALTNVVRHAQAQNVAVELRQSNGRLHLFVRDDGVGFNVAALREQAVMGASLGLLSMEERATLSDGGLEYKSTPEKGTEVHAWFPLKWRTPKT